jgi:hypothetical protein
MPEAEAAKILGELEKRESDYMRLQRTRMSADDFEPLTIIGRGAFGEVGLLGFGWGSPGFWGGGGVQCPQCVQRLSGCACVDL